MFQALQIRQPDGVRIPSERTVYRVMEEIGLTPESQAEWYHEGRSGGTDGRGSSVP